MDIDEICKQASAYYKKRGKRKKFEEHQNKVIQTNDAEYIYKFACQVKVKGADLDKLTKAIIHTHNAEYIFYFARDVEGADLDALTDAIIKTGSAYYIYNIARINAKKVDTLTNEICKSNNAECIFYFACDVKGANKYRLARAIELTNDEEWIEKFKKIIGEKYFIENNKNSEIEDNINHLEGGNLAAENDDNVTV